MFICVLYWEEVTGDPVWQSQKTMAVGWKSARVGDWGEVGASHPLILSLAAPSSPFHSTGSGDALQEGGPVESLWVDLDS